MIDCYRSFWRNIQCNLLQVASYQKQGFLLLPNLISPSLLKEVLWDVCNMIMLTSVWNCQSSLLLSKMAIYQNAAIVSKSTKSLPNFEKCNSRKVFTLFHKSWEGERWVWSVVQKASSWWGPARGKVVLLQCNDLCKNNNLGQKTDFFTLQTLLHVSLSRWGGDWNAADAGSVLSIHNLQQHRWQCG